ncbi:MAG: sigma-70 family RNA polymerase sigma factor [bacterium]|nr:sigma-70 family RNA polymerase sigma factor [bacterium]
MVIYNMEKELETSFLQAYDKYSDAIFRYCYFRVFEREQARDMTQETFMKTWEYMSSGKQVDNLRAFLYKVANNMVIDFSRKKKSSSLEELQEQGFDPSLDERSATDAHLDLEIVLGHLSQVEPKYREAILLRFVEDLSPQEIAGITGESANNISVRINRGIAQLKSILEKKTRHA